MKKHKIVSVQKGSIAQELNIEIGDKLLCINDIEIKDILDYLFHISDEFIELKIEKKNGEIWLYEIEKEIDEKLGLEFENPILDEQKHCKNKCVFCFIDQLPTGMRNSLYYKDDDARLSFLKGNFITLTNLSDEDIDKIIRLRISPINVSIHTTNPELRYEMLKNPKAKDIMKNLEKLTSNKILINGQVVLCPGYNDGDELIKTIKELFSLGKYLNSLAIVPVGLTKFREGLADIKPVDQQKAKEVIDIVERYQKNFLKKRHTRFVFAADEFYLKAGREIPKENQYENYVQIENGVGLIRKFNNEVYAALKTIKADYKGKVTIITSSAAYENMKNLCSKVMQKYPQITIDVVEVKNNFFGKTVTVAGLITGEDILDTLKNRNIGQKVLIPDVMLKSDEDIFLDDVTIKDIEKQINRKLVITEVDGRDFVEKIASEVKE